MLLDFSHGGHAIPEKAAPADDKAAPKEANAALPEMTGEDFDPNSMTPFRFLSDEDRDEDKLREGAATVEALDELGVAMVDQPLDQQNPDWPIPPIFTYWGQFLDHELTARTDRDTRSATSRLTANSLKPAKRADVEKNLFNRRTPA